jgi:hypothetical protein
VIWSIPYHLPCESFVFKSPLDACDFVILCPHIPSIYSSPSLHFPHVHLPCLPLFFSSHSPTSSSLVSTMPIGKFSSLHFHLYTFISTLSLHFHLYTFITFITLFALSPLFHLYTFIFALHYVQPPTPHRLDHASLLISYSSGDKCRIYKY